MKVLRKFLGLANYLHKYSKNYAERTKQMSDLLKKDAEWTWSEAQVDTPVLALTDVDKPLSVVCDASNIAIGSALMQNDDDGNDRVISNQSDF